MRGLGGPRKPTANVMGDRNECNRCDRSGYGQTEQLWKRRNLEIGRRKSTMIPPCRSRSTQLGWSPYVVVVGELNYFEAIHAEIKRFKPVWSSRGKLQIRPVPGITALITSPLTQCRI